MKRKMRNSLLILSVMLIALFLSSCFGDEQVSYPKPRGYFRLDLPKKDYQLCDSFYPFAFRYPVYSQIVPYTGQSLEPEAKYWFNLVFPKLNAEINFTYRFVKPDSVYNLSEDARNFVTKHIPKANQINESIIANRENRVYGLKYDIDGPEAASAIQFYVTDSVKHYIRGALYFHHQPNNDSVAPIIKFISQDIDTLLKSIRWK